MSLHIKGTLHHELQSGSTTLFPTWPLIKSQTQQNVLPCAPLYLGELQGPGVRSCHQGDPAKYPVQTRHLLLHSPFHFSALLSLFFCCIRSKPESRLAKNPLVHITISQRMRPGLKHSVHGFMKQARALCCVSQLKLLTLKWLVKDTGSTLMFQPLPQDNTRVRLRGAKSPSAPRKHQLCTPQEVCKGTPRAGAGCSSAITVSDLGFIY